MAEFNSVDELVSFLENAIDQALTEDVFPVVQEQEADTITESVYGVYTPKSYKRRGSSGGIGDEDNIVISGGRASGGVLTVENITPPNPFLNGVNGAPASVGKDLPTVIESGDGYDYWKNPMARPFTAKTIEKLSSSNAHVAALKKGLQKQGIPVA